MDYYSPVLGIQYLRLDQSDQVVKTVFEFVVNTIESIDQIAFIGWETKDVPSPNGSVNIDLQQLQKEAGASANRVYRLETVGGGNAPEVNASVRFRHGLSRSINVNFLYSASPHLVSPLSSIRQNLVRAHDVISPWLLLICEYLVFT